MDGIAAIERNRLALLRIVASLAAMAGLAGRQSAVGNRQSGTGVSYASDTASQSPTADCLLPTAATLPRHLWRTILRLLRPAEAAARRLIIAAARGIVVPPRLCRTPSPSAQVEGKRGIAAARSPSPLWGGVRGGGQIQKLALPLFDPPRRIAPRRMAPRDLPRICVPGWTARLPVPLRLAPSPDDPISAARLALRLDALARALDDLPAQARRFARLKARLDAAASSPPSIGGEVVCAANRSGGRSLQVAAPGRFRRLSPLRGGPPPGCRLARYDPTPAHRRRHDIREIDEILAHAHELAIEALDRPDTS